MQEEIVCYSNYHKKIIKIKSFHLFQNKILYFIILKSFLVLSISLEHEKTLKSGEKHVFFSKAVTVKKNFSQLKFY